MPVYVLFPDIVVFMDLQPAKMHLPDRAIGGAKCLRMEFSRRYLEAPVISGIGRLTVLSEAMAFGNQLLDGPGKPAAICVPSRRSPSLSIWK